MISRVPNELWLKVFHHLPRDALKDVSLTYHTFHNIARTLLFTDFEFHPYAIGANGTLLLPSATEVDQSLEHLAFWCSEDIAPLVHSCNVTPWRKIGPVWSAWNFSITNTPYILLAAFFERLSCFTHLQRLSSRDVHFTQIGMGNLYRLPALAHLDIAMCKVAAGETIESTSQTVGLSSFSLHDNVASETGMDHWLPLLRPDHLRELNLPCNLHLFSETIHHFPSFSHVHKLSATMSLATMAHIMPALFKFPAVQVLAVGYWGSLYLPTSIVQGSNVLPVLTEYTGSYQTLHFFLRPILSRITTRFCSSNDFITHLQGIQIPSNITSFDANFDDLDNASLNAICSLFPRLTELRIRISFDQHASEGVNLKVIDFFEELTEITALPSTLERLALCWEFEFYDEDYLPPSNDNFPEFTCLRDALVAKCPALTSLWLDGYDFLFRWRKLLDGAVDEETSEDAEDAEIMREGFAVFWEARN
ncbi:hypothetical protein C8R44DRAFT_319267 [Mycena epipterygia]|nr:hypothetical protein C8R44DRAFT_319267 [Mycena epipterygia]